MSTVTTKHGAGVGRPPRGSHATARIGRCPSGLRSHRGAARCGPGGCAGTVMALLGPNGGGKTRHSRSVPGSCRSPRVSFAWPAGASTARGVRPGQARCVLDPGRPRHLREPHGPRKPLDRNGNRIGSGEARGDRLQPVPILGKRKNQLAGSMSGGEQQMLALSRALGTDPTVLLLDELSMGSPRGSSRRCTTLSANWSTRPDDPGGRAVRPRRAADRRSRSAHAPRTSGPRRGTRRNRENELSNSYLGG